MKKLLLSVLMVLIALPAFAINIYNTPEGDKVDIYGSIRLGAAYQNSQGYSNGTFVNAKSDLWYAMFGTSRLGISFKVGQLFGNVETNFNADGSGATNFGFRQMYAGYDFGKGHKLTFGQKTVLAGSSYAFSDFFFGDNSFGGFGVLSSIRRPTLVYSYYGLDVALVVNTDVVGKVFGNFNAEANTGLGYTPGETYIPRVEIAYNFSATNLKGKVAATYALFTEKATLGTGADGAYKNINSFHVVAVVQPKFGAGYLNATAFYGMNVGMNAQGKSVLLANGGVGNGNILPTITNGKVNDVHSWGIAAEGGYNFNDWAGFVLGAGWQMNMSDRYTTGDSKKHDLNSYGVYVQAPLKLNQYMKIVPSVGYFNSFMSNTTKETRNEMGTLLAGAEFMVNF